MSSLAGGLPRLAGAWGAALLLTACGGDGGATEPRTGAGSPDVDSGTMVVAVRTTAEVTRDLDLDGYQLSVMRPGRSVVQARLAANAGSSYRVPAGRHEVQFTDVAENCALVGDSVRSVDVVAGARVPLQFDVACRPWPAHPVDVYVGEWRLVLFETADDSAFTVGVHRGGSEDTLRVRVVRAGDARVRWRWEESHRGIGDVVVTGSASMLEDGVLRSVAESGSKLEEPYQWGGGPFDFVLDGELAIERTGDQLVIRCTRPGHYGGPGLSWTRLTLVREG